MGRMSFEKSDAVSPVPAGHSITWDLSQWPPNPRPTIDPSVPTAVAAERMYWVETGALAYPAGHVYPLADEPRLVGEAEHFKRLRGEVEPSAALFEDRDDSTPARRRSRRVEYR